jgi:hypothetical protein
MAERTEELRRDIEQTRAHMSGTLDEIGDRVSPGRIAERRWQRVRDSGSRAASSVMGTPRAAGQRAGAAVGGVQSSAADAATSAAHAVGDAPERVKDAAAGNPIAAGAVAFGIGVLLGSMAPPTREEERMAEHLIDPLQSAVSDAGHQAADAVKEQVQGQLAPVVEHAHEAASEVAQHASDATTTVKDEATSATDEVRGLVRDEAEGSAGTAPI